MAVPRAPPGERKATSLERQHISNLEEMKGSLERQRQAQERLGPGERGDEARRAYKAGHGSGRAGQAWRLHPHTYCSGPGGVERRGAGGTGRLYDAAPQWGKGSRPVSGVMSVALLLKNILLKYSINNLLTAHCRVRFVWSR